MLVSREIKGGMYDGDRRFDAYNIWMLYIDSSERW